MFAHFGRAIAPQKWARAIRTEPLRGISTSSVVYRPGKDAPDLQQSIDCRDLRLVSEVVPTRVRICLALATRSDLPSQHLPRVVSRGVSLRFPKPAHSCILRGAFPVCQTRPAETAGLKSLSCRHQSCRFFELRELPQQPPLIVSSAVWWPRRRSARSLCRYISVSMLSPELVLTAELAATSRAKLAGMQNRSTFAPADAMLFTYDDPKLVSFWMKDTPIPLDIIFLNAAGVVSQIEYSVSPQSLEPIEAGQPIMAVLEVPSGAASSWGIEIGSRMVFDPERCINP